MKTYITRAEALNKYKITAAKLEELINSGQLDVVRLVDNGNSQTVIYDDDLAAYIAERDITPEKFAHLRDNLMGIGEAAREYNINQGNISRWIKQGNLEVKGHDKNRKLVSEADIAYLVELGRAKRIRPGKKVFS